MRWLLSLLLCLATTAGGANTYLVTNSLDDGTDSLRWAIRRANAHAGPDTIALASGALIGPAVMLTRPLPAITDDDTTIDLDINDDSRPDLAIDGQALTSSYPFRAGIRVRANDCDLIGIGVMNVPGYGIRLEGASRCTIRSCHVGMNRAGDATAPDWVEISLYNSHYCRIGGGGASGRNIIGVNPDWPSIDLERSSDNRIIGNYIGLARNGLTPFYGWEGIRMWRAGAGCHRNTVGGTRPAQRNVFGRLDVGVNIQAGTSNEIKGNYFGLAADGRTLVLIGCGVALSGRGNLVGGTESGATNVFAGRAEYGVLLTGPGCSGNRIQGNYFGTNAAGRRARDLKSGVFVTNRARANTIGGTRDGRNWFCGEDVGGSCHGVRFDRAGDGSRATHNVFGRLPLGGASEQLTFAVEVRGAEITIVGNVFHHPWTGVYVTEPWAFASIHRNTFRECVYGVEIGRDARACLGNLGNSSGADDGGNRFVNSERYHISNAARFPVSAEGNDFGTTSRAAISAKILDRDDIPRYGPVDFDPLVGGVAPTGAPRHVLAFTSASAVPTPRGGAEIVFRLSAPATVAAAVRNIAGRPVRTICSSRECADGASTLLWDAGSDSGLRVPNGTYLVEVMAKGADGSQARTVTPVMIRR